MILIISLGCKIEYKSNIDPSTTVLLDGSENNKCAFEFLERGKYFRYEDITYDSASHYLEKALLYATDRNMKNEILFLLADLSSIRQEFYIGLSFLYKIEDFDSVEEEVRVRSLEAKILRKLKRYQDSHVVIKSALELNCTNDQRIILLEERVLIAIAEGNELLFTNDINELNELGSVNGRSVGWISCFHKSRF